MIIKLTNDYILVLSKIIIDDTQTHTTQGKCSNTRRELPTTRSTKSALEQATYYEHPWA